MSVRQFDQKVLEKLLKEPKNSLEHLNLVYVKNDMLSIERIKKQGHYHYLIEGKSLDKKAHLERINSLVIPPAWNEVKITHLANGHLQAIGRDAKYRKQYRYHPIWNSVRNRTKFYKMIAFGKALPKIRQRVEKDLGQKGWPKTKVLALIIRLMEETHIRVGNEQYARRNKTYGLSTLRTKHVQIFNDSLKFEFTGKKGKKHKITVRNKELVRLVSRCEEIPGWELFQYFDNNGQKKSVDSSMVNEYLHNTSGSLFTAKDFRTWAASIIFFDTLMELGTGTKESDIQQNLRSAYDMAAKALGNTRNVCKKYYVHPLLVASYENGAISKTFEQTERTVKPKRFFSPSENAVLQLYKKYSPLDYLKN
ncbi:MAG: DNA topoisomerase IB [Saonia sp.]